MNLPLLLALCLASWAAYADTEAAHNDAADTVPTTDQPGVNVGRMGEVDAIPEGFQFSEAETRLWLSDHLANITVPSQLYYEFTKTGSYEAGFIDSVYLKIIGINKDGSKNASLDFFSGERRQTVLADNVNQIKGNPVLGIYMQGDVYEMGRLTKGSWRHFHKYIKIALRDSALIKPVTIQFNGQALEATKISFSPYLHDPHRSKFEQFAEKHYEIILSDKIPGGLYQIRSIVFEQGSETVPLMEEVLTLVDIKQL